MIAAPRIASSSTLASTGKVLTLAHGRSSGETNRPPRTRAIGCVEISEDRSAPARSSPLETSVLFSTRRQISYSPAPSVLAASWTATDSRCPSSPSNCAGVHTAVSLERSDHHARNPHRVRLCLVALAGRREEANLAAQHRVGVRGHYGAQLEVVKRRRQRCRVDGRIDDPERCRRGVLGRTRGVGVERVALVEQRVDELLERSLTVVSRSPHAFTGRLRLIEHLGQARVERRHTPRELLPLQRLQRL